jgi:hypothetical protein
LNDLSADESSCTFVLMTDVDRGNAHPRSKINFSVQFTQTAMTTPVALPRRVSDACAWSSLFAPSLRSFGSVGYPFCPSWCSPHRSDLCVGRVWLAQSDGKRVIAWKRTATGGRKPLRSACQGQTGNNSTGRTKGRTGEPVQLLCCAPGLWR